VSSAQLKSLRILMIAPTSFFSDYGCHVRILEDARCLQALGHRVVICTYHQGRDPEGLTVHRSRGVPWRTHYEVGSSRHKYAMDLLLGLQALRSMAQVHPDVIHAHLHEGALIGSVLARLWSRPLVSDLQGSLTAEMVDHHFILAGSRAYALFRWLENYIVRRAGQIITSTARYANVLTDGPEALAATRVTHVPDCVNTQVFRPLPHDEAWAAYRARLGVPAGRKVVVYLGLLAEYQGIDLLLHAASALCARRNDLHFVIAGFPNVEHYQDLASGLGIGEHCSFPGRIPYEDAPALLAQGDIAVFPKLSETEGAGKLLNYMAMGLPVVAFDTPAGREYLGELGIYARARDADDLARCIERTVDDPDRAERGLRLRQRAEDCYAWEGSGRLILDAYLRGMNGSRN